MKGIRSGGALAVTGVVVAQALWLGLLGRQAWFYADDWIHFAIARDAPLGWSYLLQPIFVHLAPLHRLADWLLQRLAPLDWGVASATLVALACAGTVVLDRALAEVVTGGPVGLRAALLLPYAFSVPLLGSALWWSNGLVVLPATVASLLSILLFLRAGSTATAARRVALLTGSVLAYLLALLCYVKAIALPVVLVLLALLREPGHLAWRDVRRALRTRAGFFAALVAVTIAYVAAWLASPAHYPLPRASVGQMAAFLGTVWTDALVPGVFGIDPGRLPARSQPIVVVACQVVLVALLIQAARHGARPGRAVALVAGGLLPGLGLIAWGQVGSFGPGMGRALRYVAESSWLVPLGIAVALPPAAQTAGAPTGRQRAAGPGPAARSTVPAVALGLAAYLTIATAFAVATAITSPSREGREWFGRLLRDALAVPAPLRLRDGAVPEGMLAAAFAPFNRHSRIVPLHPALAGVVVFDAAAGRTIDTRGRVVDLPEAR